MNTRLPGIHVRGLDLNLQPILTAVVAFLPPIIFLYLTLDPFEGLFEMRRITIFFTAGLIAGSLVILFQTSVLFTWGLASSFIGLIIGYVLLFPVVETLLKTIIFNFPKFQKRFQTMFDAVAFGTSYGAAFPLISLASSSQSSGEVTFSTTLILLGLCIATSSLHTGLTLTIGRGATDQDMWNYGMKAVLTHAGFNLIMLFWWLDVVEKYFLLIPLIPYGLLTWWNSRETMSQGIPQKAKRAVRIYKTDMAKKKKEP